MKIIAEEQDVEDFSDTAGVRFKFATDPPKFDYRQSSFVQQIKTFRLRVAPKRGLTDLFIQIQIYISRFLRRLGLAFVRFRWHFIQILIFDLIVDKIMKSNGTSNQ